MNKNLYRIVFNKARGLLMVVADIAGAGRAGASPFSSGTGHTLSQLIGKVHGVSFALLLALGAVHPVQAGIVADGSAPGGQQPTIIHSANGTPQINIQTPSAAGVSRNVYSQFDVDKKGVVLNNSHANTQTQIAGMVSSNPWLAKGEAKVILNEVNARNPSQLNGFIEVAGQKAQVVIANPSGITCNGCGFINANRATLTTGQAQMNNGHLTGYNVGCGEIVIQGNGLDSSQQDSTDLISRAVKVNAGIWANELNVTTGRNQVDAAHQRIDKKADDGSARPQLAIDVSQLGGMYANSIRLLGTESGVGVHNAGALGASAGDVVVNADGKLINSGAINASLNIQLAASATVDNQGKIYATANTDITSQASLSNTGLIAAGADTRISAGNINSGAQSVLAAGVASDGRLASTGNLTLTSRGELKARGQNMAGGQLNASATSVDLSGSQTYGDSISLQASQGDISTANANLSAMHQLTASTRGTLNNDGGKIAADQLNLTANRLSNQKGTVQQLGQQDLQLLHAGGINNREGSLASNSKNLTLNSAMLDNQQGTIFHAGDGQLTVNTGKLDGARGTLVGNGALSLSGSVLNLDNTVTQATGITLYADTVSHHSGQMTQSGSGPMNLNVTGLLDNLDGAVTSQGALSLNAAQLNNQQGRLIAADQNNLQLTLDGALNNRAGIIAAGGDLTSLSGAVDNSGGLIQSGAALDLNSRGATVLNADSDVQGGIISAGSMKLATGNIDNHNGQIAAQSLTATTGNVNNQAGKWLADEAISLSSGALNNQSGRLQSGGTLTLDTHGQRTDNTSAGHIVATGVLSVNSGELDNRSGKIVSGDDTSLWTSLLNNDGGQISALGDLSLTNQGVQNNDRGLIQSAKNLLIDTQGAMLGNNRSGSTGGITSQGTLTVKAGALENQQGAMISNQQITLTAENVDNQQGQIVALGDIVATSRALDNQRGTLQSGQNVRWNTQGFTLNNRGGTLSAQNRVSLDTSDFDNQQGVLASGGAMSLTAAAFDNSQQGHIASKGSLDLTTQRLSNRQGQIQSLGDMVLSAAQSVIDNGAGLIHGAANVTLNAAQALNQHTRAVSLGIQGSTVTLNATDLDNSNGQILADDGLNLNLGGELNNSTGLLSSQNNLNAQAQQIINSAGDIEAGTLIRLSGDAMTGDGKLLSLGDLTLTLAKDLLNTGSIQANNNLSLTTQGNLTNQALIQAGRVLTLSANNVFNGAAAEINAGTTQVNAAHAVSNSGLIDGFYTRINGETVSNIGSGRIYGDALAISAGTLNNLAENGQAATIAARQRLDIGATTINNRDRALIYSDGLMAVGGALNGDYQAIGQAATLNNHSATLESAGDMALNIASINNINDHFSLENVLVSQEDISEYEVSRLKNGVRYNDKDYTIYIYQDEVNILCIEGVICHTTDGDRFTHYAYTRTITEDRVKESDPAKIIAGGNLGINANDLLNDKSQIVAGGALALQGTTINNVEVEANRQTKDVGKAIFYSRHQDKGGDSSKVDTTDYVPPTVIQAIALKPSTVQEYTQGQGSGLTVSDRQNSDISGIVQHADNLNILPDAGPNAGSLLAVMPGAVTLPAGKTFEVKTGSSGSVVRAIGPNTRLPDNSLFRTHPENTSPYLVETDPRFTNQKKWLGSDYMMDAFTSNADNVLKRLGDGYYEQRLIREQIIALTGQRYLKGAQNDEEQYKALMNEGIAFGQKYNLTLGVALSAEQMSHMTGDMVWLVAQTVQLADGSTQQILVPQVYAMVQAGDVDGSGALLAGKNVSLNLSGDLINSGRITGQQNTQILADNINSLGGLIQGNDVAVHARTDINNAGGIFSGNNSLSILAGRDINAITTTRSAESAGGDFVRNTMDRVAGFYVAQANGTLALQAGRDINLQAAQVINSGEDGLTALSAGRDLNLTTATTSNSEEYIFSRNNTIANGSMTHSGSLISGQGDIIIKAGQDINARAADITGAGLLTFNAGKDFNLKAESNTVYYKSHFENTGKTGGGHKKRNTQVFTIDSTNSHGNSIAGRDIDVVSGHNVNVVSTHIRAESMLSVQAGNDITIKAGNSASTTVQASNGTTSQWDTEKLEGSQLTAGNTMSLQAGQDVNIQASTLIADKDVNLLAGQDVTLSSESTREYKGNHSSKRHEIVDSLRQQNTTIASGGNTSVTAARDITSQAAQIMASGDVSVAAGRDISLGTATESDYSFFEDTTVDRGLFSKTTTHTVKEDYATHELGSLFSGSNVSLSAGDNLDIKGSGVVGDADIMLKAGNNLNIAASTEDHFSYRLKEKKKSGLFSGGGIGFTIGSTSTRHQINENGTTQSQSVSTIGSTGGNVSILAGNQAHISGADVIAGKSIAITGDSVQIDPGKDVLRRNETFEQKTSGLTLALSGTAGSALNAAVTTAKQASEESDGRVAALQGMKAALSGVSAAQAARLDAAKGDDPANNATVGVSVSYGSQSSKSESSLTQTTQHGSSLTAGGNLNITATGSGVKGQDGDITVQGSQLQAGKDMLLTANRDVNLLSAEESSSTRATNGSKGGSVGVGITAGSGGTGFNVSANVNKGKGHENADGVSHVETTLNAGSNVSITSGRDTALTGAQVNGEAVRLEVGRNLTLTSEQDSETFDSKQQNVGAGAGYTFGAGTATASVNASRDKMSSDWRSVTEQTGIFAGKGGFDITVGEHTQLDGAVISSTATADRNRLDTGTLGFSDIEKHAEYKVEHAGAGISTGGSIGSQFEGNMAGNILAGLNGSDSASSTTHSAVSEGTIVVRDQENQQQDVASLSRDVENANPGLAQIFDKEKEQNRLKAAQLIAEIGSQVGDIARTEGQIAGEKAKRDPQALQAAREQLAGSGRPFTDADVAKQAYNNAMAPYGTGSALQQGIQAATAAIQGLAGGNIAQAVSGAASPYLAEQIHNLTEGNPEAKAMAHAVVGAVASYASGNSALAGAAGAVSGELMAGLVMKQLYPGKEVGDLTETQKQTISALGTLAAGLAGGVTGDSTGNAVAGAQAGKNAAENNFLGATSSNKLDKAVEKIKQGDKSLAAANELIKLENADKRSDALVSKFTSDPSQMNSSEQAELAAYLRVYASEMEKEYGPAVTQELVKGLLSGQDYIKRNPDSEAMSQAQTIMNTWGYHKSNASIGDSALIFGSSVLGTTIKEGMALNAAIGVGVNTGVQLTGKDPFSYVDAIMAGVTAAATTGKGIGTSVGINMGGAAIGSGIKGEDPTNSVIGAGFGSIAGSAGGKVVDALSPVTDQVTKDVVGAVTGSAASELTGNAIKSELDKRDKAQ